MVIKYLAAIIGSLLGLTSMFVGFFKNYEKIASSKLYKILVVFFTILFLILTVKSCISDEENESKASKQIARLENNIDTIKESLTQYGLTLSDDNKAIRIQGNVSINSKNGVAINNGNVENTYNQTEIDNSQKTIVKTTLSQIEKSTIENPEIVAVGMPFIHKNGETLAITYTLKTKSIEANYVRDEFIWLYKDKGTLYTTNQPANRFENPGIITCEPRKLTYAITPDNKRIEDIDTCYFSLLLTYKNILEQAQRPYKIFCRVSLKGDKKVYKVVSTKEYDETIDFITMNPPLSRYYNTGP